VCQRYFVIFTFSEKKSRGGAGAENQESNNNAEIDCQDWEARLAHARCPYSIVNFLCTSRNGQRLEARSLLSQFLFRLHEGHRLIVLSHAFPAQEHADDYSLNSMER